MAAAAALFLSLSTAEAAELKWVGCDSWNPALASDLAAAFTGQTAIQTSPEGGDSTRGIRDVAKGAADVGCSARHKVSDPAERDAKLVPVGWEALVVITHPSNPVERISERDLQAVLEGKITRWNALGGPDRPIELVVRRDPVSGVGLLLRAILFEDPGHEIAKSAVAKPSSAAVEAEVERNADALAITLAGRVPARQVKALSLDGAAPSYDNVASGQYRLVLPLYVVLPKRQTDDTKALVKFVKGSAGQQVIKARGIVNMRDGKDLFARYQKSIAEARKKARP